MNADGESRRVSDVVENFNEARRSQEVEKLFAKGAMPARARVQEIRRLFYFANGTAKLPGDTATMTDHRSRREDRADAGQVEWTFEKAGRWKIASAPLP